MPCGTALTAIGLTDGEAGVSRADRSRREQGRGDGWHAALRVGGAVALAATLVLPDWASAAMDVAWDPGSADCVRHTPAPLQTHRYDDRTFILRENPCVSHEAPFMYLLIGTARSLLIDTGDVADATQVPLAKTVDDLLKGASAGSPLLVVHTHGHRDHRGGDGQFLHDPNVEVLGTQVSEVARYFHVERWPEGMGTIDLGGRIVDVLPTPGHHEAEVSYYDRNTALFFSGDFLLPGRLLIADADADLASARRVARFVAPRPVSFVLGGHVELDRAGDLFLGDPHRPNERPLQLSKADLLALPDIVSHFNGFYGRYGGYVMMSQNRVLAAAGVAVLGVLIAMAWVVRAGLHRRRRARTNGVQTPERVPGSPEIR